MDTLKCMNNLFHTLGVTQEKCVDFSVELAPSYILKRLLNYTKKLTIYNK